MITCKECVHWQGDATDAALSIGVRFCRGMVEDFIPRTDGVKGQKLVSNAVLTETFSFGEYSDIDKTSRLITGPDFGCVNGVAIHACSDKSILADV